MSRRESVKLPSIKFTQEWDKLRASTFTTIRSHTDQKETWYRGLIGKRLRVRLVKKAWTWSYGDRTLTTAFLREVKVVRPRDLGRAVLERDVEFQGKPDGSWLLKLMDMEKALLLTFDRAPEVTLD